MFSQIEYHPIMWHQLETMKGPDREGCTYDFMRILHPLDKFSFHPIIFHQNIGHQITYWATPKG